MARRDLLDNQAPLVNKDRKEPEVCQDLLEHRDREESLVLLVNLVPLDQTDNQEVGVNLDLLVTLELQEMQDHKGLRDHEEREEK